MRVMSLPFFFERRTERHFVIVSGNFLLEQFADVIKALALEEDDRVAAGQCGIEHSLGVVRSGRENDLQAGNMTDDGTQSWECWAPYFEPTDTRKTTGISRMQADMLCHLAN